MPKGAKEEKTFIREQLQRGLSVDLGGRRIIKKYGHKIT
jgi:hypothetical protein